MTIGLIGKKIGMTRIFTDDGSSIPVTVLKILPNKVTQIKSIHSDGYQAIQVTYGFKKRTKVTKAMLGHYEKAGVEPGEGLVEFRVSELNQVELGNELKVDIFTVGQLVDVVGISKGKGFAGTIKRYNFAGQDATHGNSLSHRVPGSIGQRQSPGKVFKGKKMSGHLGHVQKTIMSQKIIKIDVDQSLILIKGAVPGASGNNIIIYPTIKYCQN